MGGAKVQWNDGNIRAKMRMKTSYVDGCWLIYAGSRHGYAEVSLNGKRELAHRVSAYLFLGYDLKDKKQQVNHKQSCPHKNCWNPDHLYVGTQRQNIVDRFQVKKYGRS